MKRKLKCVIVDDDPEAHLSILELLKNSPIGEITNSFYKPSELIESIHTSDIDVVFLDMIFPNDTLQGLDIAPMLNAENKIIIFISGNNDYIIEACKYAGAIDVIPKPTKKEKLFSALLKAKNIVSGTMESTKKEHELFFIAERKEQISLVVSDIYFVKTATGDSRNKETVLKNGERFTLMDCSFKRLLQLSPKLAQINISELVSYEIVDAILHDTIYLKPNVFDKMPRILTLSKTYRQSFKANIL